MIPITGDVARVTRDASPTGFVVCESGTSAH